ncbi:MAG: hypothetical protein OXI60_08610 [Acidiferrobacterales bacterium]|nr:hypothetical protein [Acidiferrobacterales bacterium]
MSEHMQLVQYFIETKNQDAARAIEQMSSDVMASLLEDLPDATALTALTAMLPYHASIGIRALPLPTAIGYLGRLSPNHAAAILRCIGSKQRNELIRQLPKSKSVPITLTINYSQLLVGAWMNSDIQPLPANITAADACRRIESQSQKYAIAFAVNSDLTIKGFVSVVDLYQRADRNSPITTLIQDGVGAIYASSRLKQAINDGRWADTEVLPVVDRQSKLIGAIRFVDLVAALNTQQDSTPKDVGENEFLGFTESCYVGMANLVSMTLAGNNQIKDST